MKRIKLTQGKYAIVDDIDYDYLNQFKWCVHKNGYAVRTPRINKRKYTIYMHIIIAKRLHIKKPDHRNRHQLDNRRHNLREANYQQQGANRGKRKDNTSGYKGVDWNKNKWRARIKVNGKSKFLGCFTNKKKAAIAYDCAAIKYFGEFAALNFPIKSRSFYVS